MKKFLWSILLALSCCQLRAGVLHVGLGDYSSIQAAINDANDGDTIIVDPCAYYENINFLGKAITLTSVDPNDPCIVAATVIDGSLPADANKGSVVTFNSGEDNNSVLTGFTITGGTGSWLQVYWRFQGYLWNRCGGGILCYNGSSPTVSKNLVTDNLAGQGGGMYFYDHSHPLIIENIFTENTALVDHGFEDPSPADPNVYDHGDGGAIVGFQYCDANISGNRIENNYARFYGGAIHLRQWCSGLVRDNYIADNNAALGGGIHVTYQSEPTITENTILRNYATGLGGGGIYIYYESRPFVDRNIIAENESTNGAGIYVGWTSWPVISNNLLVGNIGRGIAVKGTSDPIIVNNTICQNTAGGIGFFDNSVSTVANNIVGISSSGYGLFVQAGSTPLIRFNDVWGNPSGNYNSVIGDLTGINGNISADPCLAALGYWSDNGTPPDANDDFFVPGNYHLPPDSPCADAADNTAIPSGAIVDIDGEQRIFNGLVDMGADEIMTNPYDLNTDGIVDYLELKTLTDEWLQTGPSLQTDFHDDDAIDFLDFALLAQQWLWKAGWRE